MSASSQCQFEMLPVKKLQLDLKNPRIARWLEMYPETPTAEQIALALGAGSSQGSDAGPSFGALRQSILTNRGIIHPIIVNREASGALIVIEGNTRTQIYREFKEQKVEGAWDSIPAMVYTCLSDESIDGIRLQAHLVGVRQWDPYSKAKYLNHLRNREHLTFAQIVDFCGGDKREVNNYIQAYNDMEGYYSPLLESDQGFDPTRFSAFVELQASRVVEALVKSGYTKSDFAKWVHERKLYPLSTVRSLPRILQNEASRDTFLKLGAEEALKVLDVPTPEAALKDATLQQLAREICRRINAIRFDELQRLKNTAPSGLAGNLCSSSAARRSKRGRASRSRMRSRSWRNTAPGA